MSPSGLTLVMGSKNKSSWSLRPWLAMRMGGFVFKEVLILLDEPDTKGEIAKHSPSGRVPTLRHGDLIIWDSLAIIEYAHELAPDAHVWPQDRAARARARALSAEMHSGFAALRKNLPMNFCGEGLSYERTGEVDRDIARITLMWEDALGRAPKDGPFLFGRFSAADALFAPVVSRFRSYGVPLSGKAQTYAEAVWTLPPMKEWYEGARREIV